MTIENCTVTGFETGIDVDIDNDHFLVQANTVVENVSDGIVVSEGDHGTVRNNRAGDNGFAGIICGEECDVNIIAKNTVSGSLYGIFVSDGQCNAITGNTVQDNTSTGIHFDDGTSNNQVTNNHIHDNGSDGIFLDESSVGDVLSHNLVSDNDGAGIKVMEGNNTIAANTGKRNGGNGLGIELGGGNVVTGNEFNRNSGHGICAIPGNIDGGGNIGKNNGLLPDVTFSGC